jgi:hypothetical protein
LTRPQNRSWAPARETATHKLELHHTWACHHLSFSSLSHFKRTKDPKPPLFLAMCDLCNIKTKNLDLPYSIHTLENRLNLYLLLALRN